MSHTPGPWLCEVGRGHWDDSIIAIGPEADVVDEVLAEVKMAGVKPTDREWADARLLAAAPDMLAGLIAIRDGTVAGRVGGEDVVWFDNITTLHDFCDELIAKATGDDEGPQRL